MSAPVRPVDKLASIAISVVTLMSVFRMADFCRFRRLRRQYARLCAEFTGEGASGDSIGCPPEPSPYDWSDWRQSIRQSFLPGVPTSFLWHPLISATMVAGGFGQRRTASTCIETTRDALGEHRLRLIAEEDFVGVPKIVNAEYRTSFNRIYHCSHIGHYVQKTDRSFPAGKTVLEWGGGYGDMARIVRRLAPATTYIMIDLPELLALQYVYLGSLEGEDALNIVSVNRPIADGKINFVPVGLIRADAVKLKVDALISTWAMTESPPTDQELALANDLFGADQILLAYALDANNQVAARLRNAGCTQIPVPATGEQSAYCFR